MSHSLNETITSSKIVGDLQSDTMAGGAYVRSIEELLSEYFAQAPAHERIELIERLLGPVGPLALVTIAGGAFAHLLYRLKRDAAPLSLDDAIGITSKHVLELARYVEQSSPDLLLRVASQVAQQMTGRASRSDTQRAMFAVA